jgi:hypothetical protein
MAVRTVTQSIETDSSISNGHGSFCGIMTVTPTFARVAATWRLTPADVEGGDSHGSASTRRHADAFRRPKSP